MTTIDLESPPADAVLTRGIRTCQDLLLFHKEIEDDTGFDSTVVSKIAELCQMLKLMRPVLSSSNPGRADLARRCLADSAPGLKTLSLSLESIQEHNLPENVAQEQSPEMSVQLHRRRSDALTDLDPHLSNVQNLLRPALRYNQQPLTRIASRRRQAWRYLEESANTSKPTIYPPADLVTQTKLTTIDRNGNDNADETNQSHQTVSAGGKLDEHSETNQTSMTACRGQGAYKVLPCYIMASLGLLVIGGSLAVGLYYSIAQDRMGDGFTTAGWMTAAGTLILAAPMARHYPHCQCWDNATRSADTSQQTAFA